MKSLTIGEKLKELRIKKEKTVGTAAYEMGITQSALSNYENDIRIPRDEIKAKIARYYNQSIEYLFFTN